MEGPPLRAQRAGPEAARSRPTVLTASSQRELGLATRTARAGASNIVGRLISIVVWFLLTPLILDFIGADAYGLWVLATALLSYGYLLDLGTSATLTKYVSEHLAQESSTLLARPWRRRCACKWSLASWRS